MPVIPGHPGIEQHQWTPCEQFTLFHPQIDPAVYARLASLGLSTLEAYITQRNQRLHNAITRTVGIPTRNTFRLFLVTSKHNVDIPITIDILADELDHVAPDDGLVVRIREGIPIHVHFHISGDQDQYSVPPKHLIANCHASGLELRLFLLRFIMGTRLQGKLRHEGKLTSQSGGEGNVDDENRSTIAARDSTMSTVTRVFSIALRMGARVILDSDILLPEVYTLEANVSVEVVWDE